MDDDFNTGGALGELYELVRVLNRYADASKLEPAADADGHRRVPRRGRRPQGADPDPRPLPPPAGEARPASDRLTGPLLDLLVQLRTRVRKEKNFALADEIRNQLAALGVTLEDRPDGTGWKID